MKHIADRSIRIALLAAFPAIIMTPSAYALEMANSFYVVASIGETNIASSSMRSDNDRIVSANLKGTINPAAPAFGSSQSYKKHGAKLQLGYQFDPNFAVEGGYVDLGKANYLASYNINPVLVPWGTTNLGRVTTREARLSGWNLSGVGILPITDRFALFGKLGAMRNQVKTSDGGAGYPSGGINQYKWKPTYGVGGKFAINQNFSVRAELDRYGEMGDTNTTGSMDVDLWSLGLEGRF